MTVTGAESKLKRFGSIFKKPSNTSLRSLTGIDGNGKKPLKIDMTLQEQRDWERAEMDKIVDFDQLHIDPAPFQLVEKTSLLKVHSLFSMLGVNHAYVTAIGRLIGVVGLKELRKAIEDANSGQSPPVKAKEEIKEQNDVVKITVDEIEKDVSDTGSDNELAKKD